MLLFRHTQRAGALARRMMVVAVVTMMTAAAMPASAEQEAIDLPEGMKAADLKAPLLDSGHASLAHQYVERWVEAGTVDDTKIDDGPVPRPIKVTGLWGAKVTLRWAGNMNTLGRAEVYGSAVKLDADGVVDLTSIMRELTAASLESVKVNVADRLEQAKLEAAQKNEVLPKEIADIFTFERIARQLLVDIQLAHSPYRIRLNDQDPGDEIEYRFCSGYHGLMMTHKADADALQRVGILWPADAIARNFSKDTQLRSLLSQVQLPPGEMPTIARKNGPDLFRFRVMHVVRPKAAAVVGGQQPVAHLTRGQIIIPQRMDEATLDAMAGRIVDHLGRRIKLAPPLMGTFLPTTDNYAEAAGATDAALLTYALARRAAVISQAGENGEELQKTMTLTRASYDRMMELFKAEPRVGQGPLNPPPTAAAFAIMALIEAPNLAAERETRDILAAHLMRLQDANGHTRSSHDVDARTLGTTSQSLVFAALSQLYDQNRNALIADAANRARQAAWREFMFEKRTVSALPWLMRGETWLSTFEDPLEQQDAATGALPNIKKKERFRQFGLYLNYFYKQQVTSAPDPALAPADVVGGFDLDLIDHAQAVPTVKILSGPAMICLTLTLDDPAFADLGDRDELTLRCALGARFLAQLMIDEPGAFYVASPEDVIGGVRPTPAENDLTIDASATVLIAACELKSVLMKLQKDKE